MSDSAEPLRAGTAVGFGAYSSQCDHCSRLPRTVSRYASWIASVIGPGSPTSRSSTDRTGVTSAAVPHMKISSARYRSARMMFVSSTV